MIESDRQGSEAGPLHFRLRFPLERLFYIQTPQRSFNANLPDRNGTDPHERFIRLNQLPSAFSQTHIVANPPQNNVGIQQNPHSSTPNARARSGGSGSSKLSWTLIKCFNR